MATGIPAAGRDHPWYRELYQLESQLLDQAVRRNPGALDTLLRDDFLEAGTSGRMYTKWVMIDMVTNEEPGPPVSIKDLMVMTLTPDTALVTYRSVGSAGQVRRSSVWVKEEGRWRMAFHQGTRLPGPWKPRG